MAGLLDTLSLYGTAVLAIPIALAGLEFALVRDEPILGVALLAIAATLFLVRLFLPELGPKLLASTAADRLLPGGEQAAGDEDIESTRE